MTATGEKAVVPMQPFGFEPRPRCNGGVPRGSSLRRSSNGAFTLVELVAVIILVGIMGIAAGVSFNSLPANRRIAAARQIERDLAYARERAMATGIRHWVVFSVPGDSYSILAENPADPGRAGAVTINDTATQGPFVQRLNENEFKGASVIAASFDGHAEVGFDWLGRPLAPNADPLSTDGVIRITGGLSIFVLAGSGLVTNEAP